MWHPGWLDWTRNIRTSVPHTGWVVTVRYLGCHASFHLILLTQGVIHRLIIFIWPRVSFISHNLYIYLHFMWIISTCLSLFPFFITFNYFHSFYMIFPTLISICQCIFYIYFHFTFIKSDSLSSDYKSIVFWRVVISHSINII